MPRYKLLLIITLIILLIYFSIRFLFKTGFIENILVHQEQAATSPTWLTRSHRLSGPYAFDYIPLDFDDLAIPDGESGEQGSGTPAGSTYINPSGSPYPPGTLADMIWQQKKQDQRYGN